MNSDFDILIVGGGLVGASLACALRGSGLTVGMIEAATPPVADQPGYDDRTLVLAYGSRRIFEAMRLWETIAQQSRAAPIRHIHISDRGRFGFTRLRAEDIGLDALGYVVSAPVLGACLYRAIADQPDIALLSPMTVVDVTVEPASARVRVRDAGGEHSLNARLVVAADGANSPIREAAGIGAERVDYEQTAIVSAVTPERAHDYTAYERFTRNGPLALLPASERHCALVWTVASGDAPEVLAWDDDMFRARLQACFGERLGRLQRVGRRQAYPLALTRLREHVRPRLAVIGNAAHTVHPVAGQGFNLGLRDVAALAEVLLQEADAGRDFGELAGLRRYAAWRARDNRVIAGFTHSLIRIFSNDYLPVALARNVALTAVDVMPPLKRRLVRTTSGLSGRLPRLALGLALRGTSP